MDKGPISFKNANKFAPIQWYQVMCIEAILNNFEYREELVDDMRKIGLVKICETNCVENDVKSYLDKGGSIFYHELIKKIKCPVLKECLQNHGIDEIFAYVWSHEDKIIGYGGWFQNIQECESHSKIYMPSVDLCGNEQAPQMYIFSFYPF